MTGKEHNSNLKDVAESEISLSAKEESVLRDDLHDDIHSIKLQMLKDGIWNSFDEADIAEEQLRQFREKHPDSKVFQLWDEKKIIHHLNHTAVHPNTKNNVTATDIQSVKMTAVVGGKSVNLQLSAYQHMKLMALDDSHKLTMLNKLMPNMNIKELARDEQYNLIHSINGSLYGEPIPSLFVSATADSQTHTGVNIEQGKATSLAYANFEVNMLEIQKEQGKTQSAGITM